MTCVSSNTTGWGSANCPLTDKAACWVQLSVPVGNNQYLSMLYHLLLKLLQWTLHIPSSCLSLVFLFAFTSCAGHFSLLVFLDTDREHFPGLPTLALSNSLSSRPLKRVLFLVITHSTCELFCADHPKSLLKVQELLKAIMARKKSTKNLQCYSSAFQGEYSEQQKITCKSQLTGEIHPFPRYLPFLIRTDAPEKIPDFHSPWVIHESSETRKQVPAAANIQNTYVGLCIYIRYWSILRTVILMLLRLRIRGHYSEYIYTHTHISFK